MKNSLLIILAFAGFSFFACSQGETPKKVKEAFNDKFPAAEKVSWEMEEMEDCWEAEFLLEGVEMSACFDREGKWMETEMDVMREDLPCGVFKTLVLEFEGFEIEEVEYVETLEYTGYELEIEKEEGDEQEMELEVVISEDGKVIMKETSEEKDENEEEEDDDDEGDEDDDMGEGNN